MRKKGLRIFIILSLAEHVVLTGLLAAMIYTKPAVSEDPNEGTVEVYLELPLKEEKKPEELVQDPPPRVEIAETPTKLPGFQSTYAPQSIGYPDLDQMAPGLPRTAAADLNPESFSTIQPPRTRMLEQGESSDARGTIRMRMTPDREGVIAPPSARPIPEQGNKRVSSGQPGPASTRNISSTPAVGSSKNIRAGRPGGIELSGEVAGRKVESWPDIPEYKGRDIGEVILKFWVDPQGNVLRVNPERKPSDPELERLAIRFVQAIRFAPLSRRVKQREQWGMITIDFMQRKVSSK